MGVWLLSKKDPMTFCIQTVEEQLTQHWKVETYTSLPQAKRLCNLYKTVMLRANMNLPTKVQTDKVTGTPQGSLN